MNKQLPLHDEILFHDHPEFTPHYSPITMLSLGIFGGTYFSNTNPVGEQCWKNLQTTLGVSSPFWKELNDVFPKVSHFAKYISNSEYDETVNFFQVKSGKDQEYWESKGWIHPDDPRGWFEWYIKFYYGRRHEDDVRQIKRWKDFITRHSGMLRALQLKSNKPGILASPTTCQNLLQWSWDYSTKLNK